MKNDYQDLYKKYTTKEVADLLVYFVSLNAVLFADEVAECKRELHLRLAGFEYEALEQCGFSWAAYANAANEAAA